MEKKILSERFEIRMRDGVNLATFIYQTEETAAHLMDASVSAPYCLFIRTDYWNDDCLRGEFEWEDTLYERLISDGWVVMVQLVRGQGESGGVFAPYTQEINDSKDAMDWLGHHEPYRYLRYVLYGKQYSGQCALYAAVHAGVRPEIVGLVCGSISTDMREWGLCTGGVLNGIAVAQALDWAIGDESKSVTSYSPCQYWHAGVSPLSPRPEIERWFLEMQKHCGEQHFWEHDCYRIDISNIMHPHILAFFFCPWSDPFCPGTIAAYEQLNATCIHRPQINIMEGDDYVQDDDTYAWLHTVFPAADSTEKKPLLNDDALQNNYNIARFSDDIVIEYKAATFHRFDEVEPRVLYLGDGTLTASLPPKRNDEVALFSLFQHDPHDEYINARGEYMFRFSEIGERDPYWLVSNMPYCAVFVAPPLVHDSLILGNPRLRMWVSSNRADATFVVRLVARLPQVHWQQNVDFNLSYGVKRISAQLASAGRPPLADSGVTPAGAEEPVALDITLRPLGVMLEAGVQLHLEVTSSDYPRFITPVNALPMNNTPAPFLPAVNTIYHSRNYPSRLWLPISDYTLPEKTRYDEQPEVLNF